MALMASICCRSKKKEGRREGMGNRGKEGAGRERRTRKDVGEEAEKRGRGAAEGRA